MHMSYCLQFTAAKNAKTITLYEHIRLQYASNIVQKSCYEYKPVLAVGLTSITLPTPSCDVYSYFPIHIGNQNVAPLVYVHRTV